MGAGKSLPDYDQTSFAVGWNRGRFHPRRIAFSALALGRFFLIEAPAQAET